MSGHGPSWIGTRTGRVPMARDSAHPTVQEQVVSRLAHISLPPYAPAKNGEGATPRGEDGGRTRLASEFEGLRTLSLRRSERLFITELGCAPKGSCQSQQQLVWCKAEEKRKASPSAKAETAYLYGGRSPQIQTLSLPWADALIQVNALSIKILD